jgi:C-terminal processing protease CtpA/Prc
MYLQKLKEPQSKKPTSFGFSPSLAGNKIVAAKIINTSTVAQSGIKENTQVLSVNGISYENGTQDMYCDFITQMRNNETVKIVFLTNNEKKELVLNNKQRRNL